MSKRWFKVIMLLTLGLSSFVVSNAQTMDDTLSVLLDSIVVSYHRNNSAVRQHYDGTLVWNMGKLVDMPKFLGNSDPIHLAQMLPGIQTNSEFRSGTNIEGCDNSHNIVMLGGIPVYNACHLLGIFSVFNASHYSSMDVAKTPTSAASAGRVGGTLSFEPCYERPDSTSVEAIVGLMSSQGTIRTNFSKKTHASFSLRASYLNLLYGKWLRTDGNDIKYFFGDANVTVVHKYDSKNSISFDFYGGTDDARFIDTGYLASMKSMWSNYLGGVHWFLNIDDIHIHSLMYLTTYHNRFNLCMQDVSASLQSAITDCGIKSRTQLGDWNIGAEVALHNIQPQVVDVAGGYKINTTDQPIKKSVESSLYVDYMQPISHCLKVEMGLRTNLFSEVRDIFLSADPTLFVRYDNGYGLRLNAGYFMRHQYLYLTGFSDAGLPTEFWMPADAFCKPQYVHGAVIGGSYSLIGGKYIISADIYYRRLYNQTEYSGNIFDLVLSSFDLKTAMLHGEGENYGASLMIQKCEGKFTGWMSYTFTKARRTFKKSNTVGTYPANHERPHEFNFVANYSFKRHWSLGATFVYASGTPFTAPVSVGIVNGNIMAKYGEHNANRLADYVRLDLSANYKWKTKQGVEHGLNISLYNATAKENELFYRLKVNKNNEYGYRPVTFNIALMPSLSYFCKF